MIITILNNERVFKINDDDVLYTKDKKKKVEFKIAWAKKIHFKVYVMSYWHGIERRYEKNGNGTLKCTDQEFLNYLLENDYEL